MKNRFLRSPAEVSCSDAGRPCGSLSRAVPMIQRCKKPSRTSESASLLFGVMYRPSRSPQLLTHPAPGFPLLHPLRFVRLCSRQTPPKSPTGGWMARHRGVSQLDSRDPWPRNHPEVPMSSVSHWRGFGAVGGCLLASKATILSRQQKR